MKLCKVNNCENALCIYSKENKCILDEIEINASGHCDALILVDIPADVLASYKAKQLTAFEMQYRNWHNK